MSTWIFLRGLTRESRHWGDFPAVFRDVIEDAEIAMFDLPGNGSLNSMESPTSVVRMADHCHGEATARGLKPPYFLLAMSLGAMVAVAWARRHAHDVAGCVLINTSLRPFSPFYHRLRPANYPALLKRAVLGGSTAEWEAIILRLTSNSADGLAPILGDWSRWCREYPVSRSNALRQLWAAICFSADEMPQAPLLILASTRDRLVNPLCSRRLALCWNADCAEHATAGHDIPLDDAAWAALKVRDWLNRKFPVP